jgi:putative DNA primase/helicase
MVDKEEHIEPFDIANIFLLDRYTESQYDKGILTLRYWQGGFYVYDDGCFYAVPDDALKAELAEYLHEKDITLSSQKIALTMLCLQRKTRTPRGTELNSWLDGIDGARVLPMANGNLSFTDRDEDGKYRLLKHSPQYFTLTKLPYEYDSDVECPEWLSFLNDVMQGREDYIFLLQQWCGYLFRPDLREQKFLLCTGEGANGKGTFCEIIQALVGESNCSQVGLSRFNNPFALFETLGKVINVTNESSHIIEDEAENVLKSIVAGDRFTFERKFKDAVSAKPTAKIMIATNSLPRFNDRTIATWRRLLLVPFDKTITEDAQNKYLAEMLKKELPGILNWALEGLQKLNDAGGFTIPDSHADYIEQYRRSSDPCRAFLLEGYIYSPNGEGVACNEVYQQYKSFCEVNGFHFVSNSTFGQAVRRIFPETDKLRTGQRGQRENIYQGLVPCVSQVSQQISI